jgi:hypothetical protein
MRYIYLIKSVDDSYYKIGISKHPNKRLSQLQTGNSAELKLIGVYQSEFANQIEGTLQRRYSHLHKNGEWFDMDIKIELTFIDECQKIEETLSSLKRSGNVFI